MGELLALNYDTIASPSIKLQSTAADDPSANHAGWGFGWYPNDDVAASVIKDTKSSTMQNLSDTIHDWQRFNSTAFLCKVRGAAKKQTQHDTQPFNRSYAGRDWLFLHNGEADKNQLQEMQTSQSGFLQPLGSTDSELIFCHLIGKLYQSGLKTLSAVEPELILSWLAALDPTGEIDIVLSDGRIFLFYHGINSQGKLYYVRQTPPHQYTIFENDNVLLDLSNPRDVHKSQIIVTSSKFTNGKFDEMHRSQLVIANHATILFDNHHNIHRRYKVRPPAPTITSAKPAPVKKPVKKDQATIMNIKSMTHTVEGKLLAYRRYDVIHSTHYKYMLPVEYSTHTFRLKAVEDNIQEVETSQLEISVEGEQFIHEDVFGNQCVYFKTRQPYRELQVTCKTRVKLYATPPDDYQYKLRQASIPLVWMPWQRQMMLPYLLPPELPESELRELTDYAMSFVIRNNYNLIDTITDINQHIYHDYTYIQGSTSLDTTPYELFYSREGVCQDFANLLICLSRLLSVPARYRVGYIFTGSKYDNVRQSEASHAWVEVYLPYIGWRGFDPTNGCEVKQEHIRLACGRNYYDATPTTGTLFKGGGKEQLSVVVEMHEINDD